MAEVEIIQPKQTPIGMVHEVVPTATSLPQLQHEKGSGWKINSITRDIGEYRRDVIFDPSINIWAINARFRQYRYWLYQGSVSSRAIADPVSY